MPNLRAPHLLPLPLDLPDGWTINFEREHNGSTWQVCAVMSRKHEVVCRLSVATDNLEPDAIERHVRARALLWFHEHQQRTT